MSDNTTKPADGPRPPLQPIQPAPPVSEDLVASIARDAGLPEGPVRRWLAGEAHALGGERLMAARRSLMSIFRVVAERSPVRSAQCFAQRVLQRAKGAA